MPIAGHDSLLLKARRHSLAALVAEDLASRVGRKPGESVLVSLSGGPDSTALLVLVWAITQREDPRPGVSAVHVHHHLRASADGDVDSCRRLCARLGVPLTVVDVYPERGVGGLAARARRLRHEAVEQVAREQATPWILMGHQADDVLETILMRLGRGTRGRGLGGIPWRRAGLAWGSVRVGRPLLAQSRESLERFCRDCEVEFAVDESNRSEHSARGHLRSGVVGALAKRWPSIALHASRAADEGRCGHWALGEIAARDGWTVEVIDRSRFRDAGVTKSRALLARAMELRGLPVSAALVRGVVAAACGAETRPRQFADTGVEVEVRARAVRVRAACGGTTAKLRSKRSSARAADSQGTP